MLLPDLPESIDEDAFFAALQSLGLPGRGERLKAALFEPGSLTVTYIRQNDDGNTLAAGKYVAEITVKIGVRPKSADGGGAYLDGRKIASVVKQGLDDA